MNVTLDQELLDDVRLDWERGEGQFAMKTFRLYHNNSGGYWWLDADDWADLAVGGFKIEEPWYPGGLPNHATVPALDEADAKSKFEAALNGKFTGYEEGCPCCGEPFQFDVVEDWEVIEWQ